MTVLADRYELQELLGSGGMASVYAAVDPRLGRRVAVKLVRDDLVGDTQSRERLLREARAAASFHHPNSVAVFDVGRDGSRAFIVMELIEGESLAERLEREGRLSHAETVRIGTGVLSALEAAHERGLVHRDIKPANVLLPSRGGVKLADFGIAKAVADKAGGLTAVGTVMGTPSYLSPEQAGGEPAGPASDLYALGVVLYECLVGEPPYTGENPLAVALAHQQQPVPSLRRAAPDVPPGLAGVVERALAKEPADRYPDAGAMRRALEAALADPAAPTVRLAPTEAHAPTTVLPHDGAAGVERTAVLEEDVYEDVQPGEPPPRRRFGRLALLLLVLALLAGGALLALNLADDLEEPPEEPVEEEPEEPAEDPPAEDPPAEQPPPEQPDEEEPPAEEPDEEEPDEEEPPGEGPPDGAPPEDPPGDAPGQDSASD